MSAATRELGIDRTEAQRSIKVDSLTPEAKAAAIETGRDNNRSALLHAAQQPAAQQEQAIRQYEPLPSLVHDAPNAGGSCCGAIDMAQPPSAAATIRTDNSRTGRKRKVRIPGLL